MTALIDRLTAWPDTREARRPCPEGWSADRILSRFATPAGACWACRESGLGDRVLAALARRCDDQVATLAALAGLAPRLGLVTARWRRAGLSGPDFEDREADLVVEVLGVLRSTPGLPAPVVVGAAWHRVHGRGRTQRSRASRQMRLDATAELATDRDGSDRLASRLCAAVTYGVISRAGAQSVWLTACGWTGLEAAAVVGCTPLAFRARHARALRVLRAAADGEGF